MMWCLKVAAAIFLCSVLVTQTHCASLHPPSSQLIRQKRMTPFWRELSRPLGAACREDSDCLTRLCRNKRCSSRTTEK